MAEQARHGRGTVTAGQAVGGRFASQQRTEPDGGALGQSSAMVFTNPSEDVIAAARTRLASSIPGYAEALEAVPGSIPESAARTAALWAADGEPDEVVQQVFDHERLTYLMTDTGAAAPGRRKCFRCSASIEPGSGRKAEYQGKTYALCSTCGDAEEFRPPRPEPTVNNWQSLENS